MWSFEEGTSQTRGQDVVQLSPVIPPGIFLLRRSGTIIRQCPIPFPERWPRRIPYSKKLTFYPLTGPEARLKWVWNASIHPAKKATTPNWASAQRGTQELVTTYWKGSGGHVSEGRGQMVWLWWGCAGMWVVSGHRWARGIIPLVQSEDTTDGPNYHLLYHSTVCYSASDMLKMESDSLNRRTSSLQCKLLSVTHLSMEIRGKGPTLCSW